MGPIPVPIPGNAWNPLLLPMHPAIRAGILLPPITVPVQRELTYLYVGIGSKEW